MNARQFVTQLAFLLALLTSGLCRIRAQIHFDDVTASSGVDFEHYDGASGERFIVEYIASGVITFDYDGDGLLDLYFLNGGLLQGSKASPETPMNRLYRNLGQMRFADVTLLAGVGDTAHSLGATAGDIDNDGDEDLIVNNFGRNTIFTNNGDGTFKRPPPSAVTADEFVGAGVCMLDANCDGNLDLFLANYVDFTYDDHVKRSHRGQSVYPSPQDFPPQPDQLFCSDGAGNYIDVSVESGIAGVAGTGMGAICLDFDQDGDPDIFVCNDVMPNFLFQNEGDGTFIENGLLSGVASDYEGIMQGSMGVDCGDFDLDGNIDLFITTFYEELPTLYRNSGVGFFEDVTVRCGELSRAAPDVTWGVSLADFDNDSDPDIFMASGHLDDNIRSTDDTQTYAARNLWFENDEGKFRKLESVVSEPKQLVSRGSVSADLDNDGDLDVVVLNSRTKPTVLRNATAKDSSWLQIQLRGTSCNRDAVGARVEVTSVKPLVQEVHSGRSYQGHCGMRLHFGVGLSSRVGDGLSARVFWPGAEPEEFEVVVGQLNQLIEGTGKRVPSK